MSETKQTLVKVKGYTYARKSEYKKQFGQKKVSYTVTLAPVVVDTVKGKYKSLSKAIESLYFTLKNESK